MTKWQHMVIFMDSQLYLYASILFDSFHITRNSSIVNRVIFSLTKHVVTKDSNILHHLNYDNIFLNHYFYRYIWYIINMIFPHKLTKLWSLALPNELASAQQFTVATHQIFLHVRCAIMKKKTYQRIVLLSFSCFEYFLLVRLGWITASLFRYERLT